VAEVAAAGAEAVAGLRDGGEMRDDDVTLVAITLS
jgi:hypothetical protein